MGDEVVEVTIRADGTVSIEVEGMAGGRCLAETADLVDALGGQVEARELTAEAYVEDAGTFEAGTYETGSYETDAGSYDTRTGDARRTGERRGVGR